MFKLQHEVRLYLFRRSHQMYTKVRKNSVGICTMAEKVWTYENNIVFIYLDIFAKNLLFRSPHQCMMASKCILMFYHWLRNRQKRL